MKKTNKKFLIGTLMMVLLLCLSIVSAAEIDSSGECGDGLSWTLDDTGLLTISGTGEMTSHPWYFEKVKKVDIKYGVKNIVDDAFWSCYALTEITIPDSVTSIGESAIGACVALTEIIIPDSVTSIGELAFAQNTSLTSIKIPSNVTAISENCFLFCSKLESITLPEKLTGIGTGAFGQCQSLANVIIPPNVSEIGEGAFSGCSSLTSIIIPQSVTRIGASSFDDCTALQSAEIPGYLHETPYAIKFKNCSQLTSITILACNSAHIQYYNDNGFESILHIIPHSLIRHEKAEPTYTAEGTEEYWKCDQCEKLFSDADGINEIKEPVTIPKLVPASVKLDSLKSGKSTLTVQWKAGKDISGYEIQYGLKKNFKNAKTVVIKKPKTVKATIRKLKSKKTYYVRIRAYKTVKGKKFYSTWSAARKIKIK